MKKLAILLAITGLMGCATDLDFSDYITAHREACAVTLTTW